MCCAFSSILTFCLNFAKIENGFRWRENVSGHRFQYPTGTYLHLPTWKPSALYFSTKSVPFKYLFLFFPPQLKGIIVDDQLNMLFEEVVSFDSSMPEFRTQNGVNQSRDGKTITSPTIMWVKALDILLDKLQVAGADFSKLVAVSGTGQVGDNLIF